MDGLSGRVAELYGCPVWLVYATHCLVASCNSTGWIVGLFFGDCMVAMLNSCWFPS